MKNVEFLAKTIFSSLSDVDLMRLYNLIINEAADRHLIHAKCTPQDCTVIEELQNNLKDGIQKITTGLYML